MSELPQSLVVNFDRPIAYNGNQYESIELSEPTMKQLRAAYRELSNGGNAEQMAKFQIALVREVSGAPLQVVEGMPISKMNEAFDYLQGFMNAAPPTGEN